MEGKEYNDMTGGIDSSTAATLALLTDTARAGRYGGYYGGEGGGYCTGPFATPSANAVRIERNADVAAERSVGTRDLLSNGFGAIRDQFNTVNRSDEFSIVNKNIADLDRRISDQQFQGELRTNDRLLALQAEMNANARTAASCCCDLKLQAANDKAEMLSKMEALSKEGIARDLDRAERELVALKTQVACGCTNGCSTPCGG